MLHLTPNFWLTAFFLAVQPENSMRVVDSLLKNKTMGRGLLVEVTLRALTSRREALLKCKELEDLFAVLRPLDSHGRDFFTDPPATSLLCDEELDRAHQRIIMISPPCPFPPSCAIKRAKPQEEKDKRHPPTSPSNKENALPRPPASIWTFVYTSTSTSMGFSFVQTPQIPSRQKAHQPSSGDLSEF